MTGYNHYSSCTCGWCVGSGIRTRAAPIYWGGSRAPSFTTFATFTIPNASCPVCGASVFFYQSPAGGRVFFDELGPPWPKHPCTDNPALKVRMLSASDTRPRTIARWRREGWEPILIKSSRMDGSWHVVPVSNVITGLHFDVLSGATLKLAGETCAFMRPWDSNGWSVISYVDLDDPRGEVVVPIFERRRFSATSPVASANARRKAEVGASLGASR